ncbi:hypothetical protein LP316_04390 [Thalassotalea sp. LPB0316]|uniref:hypothetical protein n=1 Tax=Thalassotalea sp. LPB0316 TaxID=2769490 RepID=UPI0018694499|nr:hypothetical protein [Thalassotalea sp. LPB0316]QOL26544.1 hypothetical protein LP316_04390 [Thalassotalea sp. LPB0316]
MVKQALQDLIITTQIKRLLNKIYGLGPADDSILKRAIEFYENQPARESRILALEEEISEQKLKLQAAVTSKVKMRQNALEHAQLQLEEFKQECDAERFDRHRHFLEIAREVISLTEGESFEETVRKSSLLLGTIQLLSPNEGSKIAEKNEKHKPLYKAVLSLRLLDELLAEEDLNDEFISRYLGDIPADRYHEFQSVNPEAYQYFCEQVKISVVTAAIVQDIGNFHPEARAILCGDSGKESPYRMLEIEQRKELLQVSFREMMKYVNEGLGTLNYIGNSKEDRDRFIKDEKAKQVFIKKLLKRAVNPQQSIGNLLKVPQIYASIVLSTKDNYNYKVLPKVFSVLNTNAERGACHQRVVDSFYKVVGMFPQGYGVTYIPKASDGNYMDSYEYAIVCSLYPNNPEEPICRPATRGLTFISHGQDTTIEKASNLHFTQTAKRLARVSKKRLLEILEVIASNYEERKELDVLPRCWYPNDYFSIKNHQKLWNRSVY